MFTVQQLGKGNNDRFPVSMPMSISNCLCTENLQLHAQKSDGEAISHNVETCSLIVVDVLYVYISGTDRDVYWSYLPA